MNQTTNYEVKTEKENEVNMDNPLTSQVFQKRKNNETIIPKALSCEVLVLSDMSPAQTVDINVSSGILSFNRKEFDVALNRLNRSILQHRKAFLPRFIRGLCHYHLMNWNDAKKDFEVCCKSNEAKKRDDFDQALAFYNRSVVWMKLQDSKRAMDDLNTAISMFSFEKTFYKNRALLLRRFGDFQSAQNDYKLIRRFEAEEKRNDSPGGLDFKSRMNMGSIKQISRTSSIRPVCFGRDGRRKTIIMKRPGSKQSQMRDELRTSIFGQVHFALTCESSKRTNAQIDLLVNESRMMAAFAQLNVDQISALWKYLEYRKYPSNVRIFEQGDIAQDYFLIWSGSVSCRVANQKSILKHTNISRALAMEREFIVNTITAGETLGEAIISEDATRKAACVTEEPSEMLVLNRKNFDKTFEIFVEKSQDEKRSFLSDFDFFSSWSNEKMEKMVHSTRQKTFHMGEKILQQNYAANGLFLIKTGVVSLIRRVQKPTEGEEEPTTCNMCVAKLSSGDIFGQESILSHNELAVFPYTALCETWTICYRLDKMQMAREDWDAGSRERLSSYSASYPDDSVLLQTHFDDLRFRERSASYMKALRKDTMSRPENFMR